jgi:hypothetical protein
VEKLAQFTESKLRRIISILISYEKKDYRTFAKPLIPDSGITATESLKKNKD